MSEHERASSIENKAKHEAAIETALPSMKAPRRSRRQVRLRLATRAVARNSERAWQYLVVWVWVFSSLFTIMHTVVLHIRISIDVLTVLIGSEKLISDALTIQYISREKDYGYSRHLCKERGGGGIDTMR